MRKKASVLAMAHLIGRPTATPLAVNEDRAVSGLSNTDDNTLHYYIYQISTP